MEPCPFCERIKRGEYAVASPHAAAILDAYPISPGHTLIVPRRHEADLFALPAEELDDLWRLVAQVRRTLDIDRSPDGYNVGVNVGAAAGQTVVHAHLHLIPRCAGDVPDPRGGVRWVIPARADYWTAAGEHGD
jgi:diadenosine tetraphosphate (Ap4A) HIT family hydrolase